MSKTRENIPELDIAVFNLIPRLLRYMNMDLYYSELGKLGVDIDELKKMKPTEPQLRDLLTGLRKLQSVHIITNAT